MLALALKNLIANNCVLDPAVRYLGLDIKTANFHLCVLRLALPDGLSLSWLL